MFRAFYDRTARTLWTYLWRMTGDRQAADDLLQETYYRLLRTRTPYQGDAHRRNAPSFTSPRTWRAMPGARRGCRPGGEVRLPGRRLDDCRPPRRRRIGADDRADLSRAMRQLSPP